MQGYIEALKKLVNDIENEKDFNNQLKLTDELCDLSLEFYDDMLHRKYG
jgi:predicted helicase